MMKRRSLLQILATAALEARSWKLSLDFPPLPSYVLVAAPHTSNWDFVYFLLFKFSTGIHLHWIGKESLFRFPFGLVMSRLGGIPIDRSSRNNYVAQMVDQFRRGEQFIVLIAPEGTRSKAQYWKTGFYYIALGAGVPVSLGFIDYASKRIGFGPYFFPTGDIQSDFRGIRSFYAGKTGKYPDSQGEIRLLAEINGPDY